MSAVIIKPASAVFRRCTPLLVIFGARLPVDRPDCARDGEGIAMAGLIAQARRYRVEIAFCCHDPQDRVQADYIWREGIRPRISDRVFCHADISCFSNPQFKQTLRQAAPNGVCFCGPVDDSAFHASVVATLRRGFVLSLIDSANVLHKRNAKPYNYSENHLFLLPSTRDLFITSHDWIDSLRVINAVGGSGH